MNAISVVMTAYKAEENITEAIESVLNQSFSDFEFIILNDSSNDNTREIICSYDDKRIRLIDNERNQSQSLYLGLKAAKGKYIARFDANDIMHIDRLKIQYAMMEEFPQITICSSREIIFGEKIPKRINEQQKVGLIENPLMTLLLDDTISHSAYMIRRSFISDQNMMAVNDAFVDDYQLWVETAKQNGVFYVESQPLVYKRISDLTISRKERKEKLQAKSKTKKELLYRLCLKNETYPSLISLCNAYYELSGQKLISENEIVRTFHSLFRKNKDKLNY